MPFFFLFDGIVGVERERSSQQIARSSGRILKAFFSFIFLCLLSHSLTRWYEEREKFLCCLIFWNINDDYRHKKKKKREKVFSCLIFFIDSYFFAGCRCVLNVCHTKLLLYHHRLSSLSSSTRKNAGTKNFFPFLSERNLNKWFVDSRFAGLN